MKKGRKENKVRKTGVSKKKSRRFSLEVFFLILFFFSLFILISLFSYHPNDPSWTSSSSFQNKVKNYGGRVGAFLSDALLQFLGLAAFFLPLGLIYISFQVFLVREETHLVRKLAGLFFFLLVFSPLLSIVNPTISWKEITLPGGGLLGSILSSVLINLFNHTGSLILLSGLLLASLMLTTRFSLTRFSHFLSSFFGFLFKEVHIRIINYRKEKERKKMRRRVQEKYTTSRPSSFPVKQRIEKKNEIQPAISPPPAASASMAKGEEYLFPEIARKGDYRFPPLTLLDPGTAVEKIDKNELYEKKQTIEAKLREFRVEGEVREYHPGPIITTYEFYPFPGIKVSQVANLSEDLSLALGAESVRIQRIPGKSSLGVEVPNRRREVIKIRDVMQSENFQKYPSKLTFALGKTVHGEIYLTDLSVMPHLLIAGATGTGKSVALNSLIASIMYKATPDEVKLILIDPKRLEFSLYDGVPHLLSPVVRDPKKAGGILLDAVKKMEERYKLLGETRVRNIEQYNQKVRHQQQNNKTEEDEKEMKPLPYLVIIIDELSELMMIGAQDVEYCIARLAQLARAVGIHLVMATQRPSIDVITGTVKNNFPCRIAFRVPSKVDSRIIIDTSGAEKLLGNGDMLFMPPNYPRLVRIHGSYISLAEITRVVNYVKDQGKPQYDEKIVRVLKSTSHQVFDESEEKDPLFDKAVELVLLTGQASASYLQRKLKLGYARASRIIDQMEQENIVGPSEGSKPREILVDSKSYLEQFKKGD